MDDVFEKFYDRTLRFLSYRPRSEKEIVNFLKKPRGRKKEKIDEPTIEKILKKLKEHNFVNDEEFARWLVEQRQGRKPRGKRLIKIELKQKGIADEIISSALSADQIPNEKELAKRALEKKVTMYRRLSRQEAHQKLSQFLLRRGFTWEIVKEAVDEVFKKE